MKTYNLQADFEIFKSHIAAKISSECDLEDVLLDIILNSKSAKKKFASFIKTNHRCKRIKFPELTKNPNFRGSKRWQDGKLILIGPGKAGEIHRVKP